MQLFKGSFMVYYYSTNKLKYVIVICKYNSNYPSGVPTFFAIHFDVLQKTIYNNQCVISITGLYQAYRGVCIHL